MRQYTKEHEWVEMNGTEATVGISSFAQSALGDIVYVELPKIGTVLKQRQPAAVVESVKTASDIYAPLSGTVVAINPELAGDPTLVNRHAEGKGWFFRMTASDLTELGGLLDEDSYHGLIGTQS